MTIKSTKLAALLVGALSLTAPLIASPADAAAFHNGGTTMSDAHGGGARNNIMPANFMADPRHRPAPRHEMRPPTPHRGFHWHQGRWNFARGHWVWVQGFWNIR
jgi:hypothetical protein